ncbi:MAG TPA: cytochrome c oxidase subunit 3 family protein [Blastocatellia bacterium]|nr:cytochrome c oxidase subunit 3 family protein [Blastocatellia bacterium]
MAETLAVDQDARGAAFAHQFDNAEQQRDAATMGMWVFLVTEIMFFGGLFASYVVYRAMYPAAFAMASQALDIKLGTLNTAVLLLSSFTMVVAVFGSQTGRRRLLVWGLALTIALGLVFLAIKFYEYYQKYVEHHVPGPSFAFPAPYTEQAKMYFTLYFAMTGLHAMHMIVGCGLLAVLIVMARRGRFTPEYHSPVEISGLYWHFVDIIWIFLYPLLYLIGRHLR